MNISLTSSAQTELFGVISADRELSRDQSPYVIATGLTISPGVTLTIQPGVTIEMGEGVIITVNGTLVAMGTRQDSIYFRSYTANSWSRIVSDHADLALTYCHFTGNKMLLLASGGENITISNSVIESRATGSGEDCIAVHDVSRVFIDSIKLYGMGGSISQGSKNDAIDLDNVDSCFILNSVVASFSDDGVDIGTASRYAIISGNIISHCNYGTSVGENSTAFINNNVFTNNDGALQVHNQAVIYADYNTLCYNSVGVECYHSEEGSSQTGGIAYIRNTIFLSTQSHEITTQTSSEVTVNWSISDRDILSGDHNLLGNALLKDPAHGDFSLLPDSPCIGAGSPDAFGNPTTMGAWGGNGNQIISDETGLEPHNYLIFPNPVTGFLTIKSLLMEYKHYSLYDDSGRAIITGNLSGYETLLNLNTLKRGTYILFIGKVHEAGGIKIVRQ